MANPFSSTSLKKHPGLDEWVSVGEDGRIAIRTGKVDIGQRISTALAIIAAEELDVDYNDGPLEIGFNSKYLLDITQQIEGDDAKFQLSDGASPMLVQDMGDTSALYVLMPMRV